MGKKNILVFPCGSEVALEIYRSLKHSIHFNLIGANSVDDHGKFVFENYVGDVPFVNDENFIDSIKQVVIDHKIDAIYPAMDAVINVLKANESEIGCTIISSSLETTEICLSKSKSYATLGDYIKVPKTFKGEIETYPVFIKPDIGYGSRGVLKANSLIEVENHLKKNPDALVLEYLPGKEYTVDCFTNYNGELLFAGPRERKRVSNGISVNTSTMPSENRFIEIAKKINERIKFNGAWFFQVKENEKGTLVLLEISSRIGGSSSTYRAKGINFAMLSVFNAFKMHVSILENDFDVELDRALGNVYKFNIEFNHVYVDLDDTLIVDDHVNYRLIGSLYKFINQGKKIHLITKHKYNLKETLLKNRLSGIFDSIIHLKTEDSKSKFINHKDSIFIDDSFAERKDVLENMSIPVFGVDIKL
ncbi:ATP-grasp domain-containing protein [Psychroserpens sp.]